MSYLLLVDDEESIRILVRAVLRGAGHEVTTAANGHEALQAVAEREPDLIVLDLSMPGMNGLEVCRALKSNPFTARIPILMLTAQSGLDFKIEGFEAGADEYLGKPFEPRELVARVGALLRLVRRESDRNPSSGLPGGRAIREEIARRSAGNEAFAVCYLDLDHFKPFADAFGFAKADEMIAQTGAAINEAVREYGQSGDFAGHIGGDDFIVVCGAGQAEKIARASGQNFDQLAQRVLGEELYNRGIFDGIDREGRKREFPMVRLTAAVLCVEARVPDFDSRPATHDWTTANHLGAYAAEVKRQAKARGGGTVLVRAV